MIRMLSLVEVEREVRTLAAVTHLDVSLGYRMRMQLIDTGTESSISLFKALLASKLRISQED